MWPPARSPDRKRGLYGLREQRLGVHDEMLSLVVNRVPREKPLQQLERLIEHFASNDRVSGLCERTEL